MIECAWVAMRDAMVSCIPAYCPGYKAYEKYYERATITCGQGKINQTTIRYSTSYCTREKEEAMDQQSAVACAVGPFGCRK